MSYFGLYIPSKREDASKLDVGDVFNPSFKRSDKSAFVFCKKEQALHMLKEYKDARMREFAKEDDAVNYAQTGYEEVPQNKYDDLRTSTAGIESEVFRAPIKQSLSAFRRLIESGEFNRVKATVWENPRYLVSSGGTPTTLKEGCRYNALHVCAISKQPKIAELILQTVSDWKFVNLLTGTKNDESMCKELCSNLLDYYLNMPEKGRSETPLHLAAKYGDLETAQVIISYPESKMTRNNEGAYPIDIICTRRNTGKEYELRELFLRDRFYVPVYRSDDSSVPPKIGEPFSLNDPPPQKTNCDPLSPEVKIKALAGPMNEDKAKQLFRRWKTPPRQNISGNSSLGNISLMSPMHSQSRSRTPSNSPLSYTGTPTSKESHFQRRSLFNSSTPQKQWHCPSLSDALSRSPSVNGSSEASKSKDMLVNGNQEDEPDCSFTDSLTEFENKNNNNHILPTTATTTAASNPPTRSIEAPLCPQTPLLKMKKSAFFIYRDQHAPSPIVWDIAGAGDVSATNSSFESCSGQESLSQDSVSYKERNIKITDTDKGLEVIGRQLAKDYHVEWREYWDFLDEFIDISTPKGRSKLEDYLGTRLKDEEVAKRTKAAIANSSAIIDDVVVALEKFGFQPSAEFITGNAQRAAGKNTLSSSTQKLAPNVAPQSTMPYTCVEKSLQVFAKRMTKTIINNIDNVVSINDTLLSELKRLKSLICSFKEDLRFKNVSFEKVHSRIGNLVSIYLNTSQGFADSTKSKIQKSITNLLATPGDRREHIDCVCARISYMLNRPTEQILPEILKTEAMCEEMWLQEKVCECEWENNLSRKPTRRNRSESRTKISSNPFSLNLEAKMEEKLSTVSPLPETILNDTEQWCSPGEESDSSNENDTFWSDFGSSDSDEEDSWRTPPSTPQKFNKKTIEEKTDAYSAFIFGKEPTKRDMDVLYAIERPTAAMNINMASYPHTLAWKTALLLFTKEEIKDFPSPTLSLTKSQSSSFVIGNNEQYEESLQKPITKRLLPTSIPPRPKSIAAISSHAQPFNTPINKPRGLYTAYRQKQTSTPISPMSPLNNKNDCSNI